MASIQTLLVDGYISQTFRSRSAEQYFQNLLKSTSVPPQAVLSYPGREGNFFFLHSVPSHIPAQNSNPGRWLLDRGVVTRGTVVPQTMWSPHTVIDRRQQVDLQMPVFFEGADGRLGISLEASATGQCFGLRDANHPAPLGEKPTTNLRIAWPGYREFKRQIQVRDETSAHNPITTAQFAHQVGRAVDAFLQVRPHLADCEKDVAYYLPGFAFSRLANWTTGLPTTDTNYGTPAQGASGATKS